MGEGPEPFVLEVAQEEGLALPASFQARQLVPETDIVAYDLVLVMDKFTAADVLREVSLHHTNIKLISSTLIKKPDGIPSSHVLEGLHTLPFWNMKGFLGASMLLLSYIIYN